METLNLLSSNMIRTTVILFVITLQLYAINAVAQGRYNHKNTKSPYYLGFGASFGVRAHKVASNFEAINNNTVLQEGGSAIIITGNRVVRAKLEAGLYYSAASMAHSIDLVEMAGVVNLYPLQMIKKGSYRISPYTISGVTLSQEKFYGYYHSNDATPSKKPVNYSASQQPYLGKSTLSQVTLGLGVEYRLIDDYNFVHLFAEARTNNPINASNTEAFEATSFTSTLALNVGVVFGMHR